MNIKTLSTMGCMLALMSMNTQVSAQAPAAHNGHGAHLSIGNLSVACRRGGGPAFADFETVHFHHALRLAAQTTTSSNTANGEAIAQIMNVSGLKFHTIEVQLTGDCQVSTTGWFEVFVTYTPPGSSSSQSSSFQCQDMQVPGHPGTLLLTSATTATNGDESIPDGSTLISVGINEQCDQPSSRLLQVFVYDVSVNHQHALFDFRSPAASCTAD